MRPGLKRSVYSAWKKNKLNAVAGDYYKQDFGKQKFDHILMPNSFFPPSKYIIQGNNRKTTDSIVYISHLHKMIEKLVKHLNPGGSLRISNIAIPNHPNGRLMKESEATRQFNDYLKNLKEKGHSIKVTPAYEFGHIDKVNLIIHAPKKIN